MEVPLLAQAAPLTISYCALYPDVCEWQRAGIYLFETSIQIGYQFYPVLLAMQLIRIFIFS